MVSSGGWRFSRVGNTAALHSGGMGGGGRRRGRQKGKEHRCCPCRRRRRGQGEIRGGGEPPPPLERGRTSRGMGVTRLGTPFSFWLSLTHSRSGDGKDIGSRTHNANAEKRVFCFCFCCFFFCFVFHTAHRRRRRRPSPPPPPLPPRIGTLDRQRCRKFACLPFRGNGRRREWTTRECLLSRPLHGADYRPFDFFSPTFVFDCGAASSSSMSYLFHWTGAGGGGGEGEQSPPPRPTAIDHPGGYQPSSTSFFFFSSCNAGGAERQKHS